MQSDSMISGVHRRPQVIFGLAAATSFLLYLHRYTWNLVRPELQAEYQLSNTQLEALGSAFFFPYALGQIPGGILCDLFGPHLFLVVIIIAWSAILPLHGMTGNFASLIAVRGAFGLSQAGCYPALSQVTRAWFHMRRRTQVQGWIASAFGRGGGAMASIIMGSLLMGYLQLHWLTSLWILSAAGIVFALIFLVLFRNAPSTPIHDEPISLRTDQSNNPSFSAAIESASKTAADTQSSSSRVLPFRVALRNRSYVILLCQQFLNAGSDVVFALILGSYFISLGCGPAQLGLLISLPIWGGAVGGIVGGYANDWAIHRFPSRRWSRSGVAAVGLTMGGILVTSAVAFSNPLSVAVGLLLAKFFVDWSQPTVWGTCTDLGGRYSATVFGINNMCGNLGSFFTPFAVGLLLDYNSTVEIMDGVSIRRTNFVPAFILSGSMMLTAAVLWLFIDCTRKIVHEKDSA